MKKARNYRAFILLVLCVALTLSILGLCGCNKEKGDSSEKTVTVTVVDSNKKSTVYKIITNSPNLRGALEQENLVRGDEGEYGLYIKYVNGERADYDLDKAYWALYKDGEILMSSVDQTVIHDGDKFELVYTKG